MHNDPRYVSVRPLKKRTATLLKMLCKAVKTTRIQLGSILCWLTVKPSLSFLEETLVLHKA